MRYLLGKKVGMTQYIDDKGTVQAATVIEAGPCFVTQVKDNQPATFQIGFSVLKKANKPISNHLKEKKLKSLKEALHLRRVQIVRQYHLIRVRLHMLQCLVRK